MVALSELLAEGAREEQTFTHCTPDGTYTHILVDRLKASDDYKKLEIVRTEIKVDDALRIIKNNGIEKDHLSRITVHQFLEPITFINWEQEGTQSLVDGNHRYIKAFVLGLPFILARLVPEPLWRQFVISDIPPDVAALLLTLPAKPNGGGTP